MNSTRHPQRTNTSSMTDDSNGTVLLSGYNIPKVDPNGVYGKLYYTTDKI